MGSYASRIILVLNALAEFAIFGVIFCVITMSAFFISSFRTLLLQIFKTKSLDLISGLMGETTTTLWFLDSWVANSQLRMAGPAIVLPM